MRSCISMCFINVLLLDKAISISNINVDTQDFASARFLNVLRLCFTQSVSGFRMYFNED